MNTNPPRPAPAARARNLVISGTNFWNPGDDFVRDGVIRVLHEVFPGEVLNFLFYNFNADFFPQSKFTGIGNYVSRGDLDRYRQDIDAVVIAGLSAGGEIKDLYRWVVANQLARKVWLIGAGYENDYVAQHIGQEPEATIFREARIVIGRTAATPDFIKAAGIPYHHINCPAILSVPEVKAVPAGQRIERIGFSIQLPHGEGLGNHSCDRRQYELAVSVLRLLARNYAVEVVAHHKTEYFHFLNLLRGENIPVIFSSFYQDLHQIYPRYDLVITTRLHSSLFANGHGIPGIIINDTDRHTHTLQGFPHSVWVSSREKFDAALAGWNRADLAGVARDSARFKSELLGRYVAALRPIAVAANPEPQAVNPVPVPLPVPGLPVHFFTIVLNGQPFIRQHIAQLRQLPFAWHWHIVEGVAELSHDTGWSKASGGKIPAALHRAGLSVDGTTEYLDALKQEFPDHITIYRPPAGKFWDGKREMVNAPLANISQDCLLWQIDVDELWTRSQIIRTRALFLAHPEKTAAYFFCHYFVGPELVITSRDTYGNNSSYEWLRVWRYHPGDRWAAHEPPQLHRGGRDIAALNVFRHAETEAMGLVFHHYAYVLESQLRFKESYYGYAGAVAQWRRLQEARSFPLRLADYFNWVTDGAVVNPFVAGARHPAHDELFGRAAGGQPGPLDGAQRILFVRTDAIGDSVLASAVLGPIRKRYPQAKLAVLCQRQVADLFTACPHVDSVICYEVAELADAAGCAQIVGEITAFNPNVILNSTRSRDRLSDELTLKFGPARHIAIEGDLDNVTAADQELNRGRYQLIIPTAAARMTELARHGDFLRGLGIAAGALQPGAWTGAEDETLADVFFQQHQLDPARTIAVFPGAQREVRVYSGYADALQGLAGFRFLVFGVTDEDSLAQDLGERLPGRIINLCGRSTLRETAALLRRCRLYVGAESGGAHLACALGVPNVVLLGGGHIGRFMPYSPLTSAAVLPLDCFGCNWRCPHPAAYCIKEVSPALVAEAIRQTLAKNSLRPRIFLQSSNAWPAGSNRPVWKKPDALLSGLNVEFIEVPCASAPASLNGSHPLPGANPVRSEAAAAETIPDQHPGRIALAPGPTSPGRAKIVGMVPGRNEAHRIEFCLRALAQFTDAIVYLDDCSTDDSVAVVESLARECRIERIIRKQNWHLDEPADRNAMLQAGREIGGTHFIALDADEAFTANCAQDDSLRRQLLNLRPGDRLEFTWIQLWRSVQQYRFDGSVWTNNVKPFAFCDDGRCHYDHAFFTHTPRVPKNLQGRTVTVGGYVYGVLHFQFVNWRNLQIKQAWYRCLEHIRDSQRTVAQINARYAATEDETGLATRQSPANWFSGYGFFDPQTQNTPDERRLAEVRQWFQEYGQDFFAGLDIWRVDWGLGDQPANAGRQPAPVSEAPMGHASHPQRAEFKWELSGPALSRYFQPPAGSTERHIDIRPTSVAGVLGSSFQALKNYEIRDFGRGLAAAEKILAHILGTKFKSPWKPAADFWHHTVVLPVVCDLVARKSGQLFAGEKPASLDDISPEFAQAEAPRAGDINNYAHLLRTGGDLGSALYVSGALLKQLAPAAQVELHGLYMMDGARRLTASALAHRRTVSVLILLHESELAALLPEAARNSLRERLAAIKWFESYQSIPLLGLKGERSLRRFELMPMPLLRDAVVMDFGCNTGQACLQAVQAGARQVIGIEGMPDTFAAAQAIGRLAGFANLRYGQVNFNDGDFDRQIDAVWPEPVDYSFFFSVYRTKELVQRDRLMACIIQKTRQGIFFEGHAHPKIDTLEYYDWLFESFGLKYRFLGNSEGPLRPLFYLDILGSKSTVRTSAAAPSRRPMALAATVSPPPSAPVVAQTIPAPLATAPVAAPVGPGSDTSMPLVTAVVSAYASERFMEGCLRNLVTQTLGERLEIMVVDTGSPEKEGEIVRRFMEQHPNIRYLRIEQRETVTQAYNRGVRAARGKYVITTNTDDRLRTDALERLAQELDAHPEVGLVYADYFITNTENDEFYRHVRTGYSRKPDYHPNIMLDGCHMGPQPMWRRSLHEELGWFDEQMIAAGDYELWCRFAAKHPFRHVPEFLGLYLHNPAGVSNSNAARSANETARIRATYASQFPPPPPGLPRGFFYRDAVPPHRYVNISMVTYNRLDFTRQVIETLVRNTDFPYVLTVVDNCSRDGTREYLTELRRQGVIRNLILLEDNVGVAKAANLAWQQEPQAGFYLKLDNDILLQKSGWLKNMVEVLEGVPQLGAVAYNFEPISYPVVQINRHRLRPKPEGNLGGACILIPKRTQQALGYWCEEYGLYGEEDYDYCLRIRCQGRLIAYMEDEDTGFHLPSGRAALINPRTFEARDGQEEMIHRDYRQFKDDQRRQQVSSGKRDRFEADYRGGARPLYQASKFAQDFAAGQVTVQPHDRRAAVPQAMAGSPPSVPSGDATTGEAAPVRPGAGSRLKVAVLSLDEANTACAFLRWQSPLTCLARNGVVEFTMASQLKGGKIHINWDRLRNVNIVMVQRGMAAGLPYATLRAALPDPAIKIVFELDDALTMLPPTHKMFAHFESVRPRLEEYLSHADLVTVSTPKLKQFYSQFSDRIVVLPNALDADLWRPVPPPPAPGGKVVILFSGTLDHQSDLAVIEPAIERIIQEFPGQVEFLFWGNAPATLRGQPQIKLVGEYLPDYRDYAHLLRTRAVDLALVPLEAIPFNQGKSPIKWLEYSACGIPAVFTDCEAYRRTVEHGQTGWLVPNQVEAWYEAMKTLIQDAPLRRRLAENARQTVLARHMVEENASRWQQAYEQALAAAPKNPASPAARVSIIIPTFNRLDLTRACLHALRTHTPAADFEMVVVDNASTDGTPDFLAAEQKAGRLTAICNAQNGGFARACNQGAAAARAEVLLFLNNDTQVTAGWLDALVAAVSQANVGVAGAKLLYANGTIQHAGIEFMQGLPDHPYRHSPGDAPAPNQFRELDMVTGACFMIHRRLFRQLAGFDEIYRNGVEDIDLCLRVRAAGFKVVYEPKAVVFHLEGQSAGRFDHVNENLRIFFARWRSSFDQKARFMVPPTPRFMPASQSLLLAPAPASAGEPAKPLIAWEGSFLDYGSLSHINRELTARLAPQLNLVCVGRNTPAKGAESDSALRNCARQLVAVAPAGTAVTVRHQWPPKWSRPASGLLVVIQPWEYGTLPEAWVQTAGQVDEFWVPSPIVRKMYVDSGIAPEKVRVVPNGVDSKAYRPGVAPLRLATQKKFKFLFVGGTIYRKGPDALLEAFTRTFSAQDDVCLVIKDFGGDSCYQGQTAHAVIADLRKNPDAPEILYLTEDLLAAQMPALYAACDCFVLPYRGEGFGLPVLEAMACGLPVIVTANGATDGFVTTEAGWKIPSVELRLTDRVGEIKLVKPGWMFEPSKTQLGALMQYAATHVQECRQRGAAGRAIVEKDYDWDEVAAGIMQRLTELAALASVQPGAARADSSSAPAPAKPFVPPAVAHLGHLADARALLRQKNWAGAWTATLAAIARRPFHPEAHLLLAEIALAAGDAKAAKRCAQRARELAPGWNAPKQFLTKPLKGSAQVDWLQRAGLPEVCSQPRLSVCVIAKNEERFIAQCLKSVQGTAAQIVLVDTGSTDRTVEIARELGAEIHSFAWGDDFAAARNAALEHATGDWVLMLDADEELPAAQHVRLAQDMGNRNAIAFRLPLINAGKENEGRSFVPRLFRNAPGVFYRGRIHEQVFPSLLGHAKSWGLKTALGSVELRHHGYTAELVRDRNKVERNLKLLAAALAEDPDDINLIMNLGMELVRSDNLAQGIEKYRTAYERMSAQPEADRVPELREVLLTQFTSQLYKVRRHEEVVQVLTSPLARNGGLTASLHFALGLAYFELKQFSEAADQMRQCLARRHQLGLTPINTDILTSAPQHCLAICLAQLAQAPAAEKAFAAALAEGGPSEIIQMDWARFLRSDNRPVDALKHLHAVVGANPRQSAAWQMGGEIALSRAEFLEFAGEWTGEALQALPENPVIAAQRAEALMLSGHAAAAAEVWEKIWRSEHEPRTLAALVLCETAAGQILHAPHGSEDEQATSRAFVEWYQKLIAFRAHPLLANLNGRLDPLSGPLPTAAQMLRSALAAAAPAEA